MRPESTARTARTDRRPRTVPRAPRGGTWALVSAATVATVMSAPGQTAAISVFTDPLIAELGISRNALSTSYLVGTLTGAAAMPLVGRALDRFGVRRVMAVIGVVFGAVLMGLSVASDIVGLTAGFIGVRLAGQGALGLAASTAVAVHVTRRRGLALGIKSAVGSAGISLAPVLLERVISTHGMATAWRVEALAVWAVVIPVALLLMPGRAHVSLPPADDTDDDTRSESHTNDDNRDDARSEAHTNDDATPQPARVRVRTPPAFTVREAVRTPMFWAIAAGLAASGLLTTALNFHQIAILGERGLTTAQAAFNFVPQAAATMAVTIGVGALTDRVAPKLGVAVAMVLLSGSLLVLPVVDSGWTALVYGGLLGAAGGAMRTVEAAAYTHYFGTAHIGAIRGLATTINVGSTAFGPLALSLGHGLIGSYAGTTMLLAAIPAAVALFAVVAPAPRRETPRRGHARR